MNLPLCQSSFGLVAMRVRKGTALVGIFRGGFNRPHLEESPPFGQKTHGVFLFIFLRNRTPRNDGCPFGLPLNHPPKREPQIKTHAMGFKEEEQDPLNIT